MLAPKTIKILTLLCIFAMYSCKTQVRHHDEIDEWRGTVIGESTKKSGMNITLAPNHPLEKRIDFTVYEMPITEALNQLNNNISVEWEFKSNDTNATVTLDVKSMSIRSIAGWISSLSNVPIYISNKDITITFYP